MLVNFFYKLTNDPNIKKNLFFRRGGGGGVVAGRVNIIDKCLKWHFYSSRTTNVPILKYMFKYRRNGQDRLNL